MAAGIKLAFLCLDLAVRPPVRVSEARRICRGKINARLDTGPGSKFVLSLFVLSFLCECMFNVIKIN